MSRPQPKAKVKLHPVMQIYDGEWITIEWNGQQECCCDCGLIHSVDHRVVDGQLQFRATQLAGRR